MPADRKHSGSAPVRVTVRSFEILAADCPLSFGAPFSRAPGDHFEYWWHLIQYAFELPDPRTFPPLQPLPPQPDRVVLDRYIAAASDLADSHTLHYPTKLTVEVHPERGEEKIVQSSPPNENIRGFSVLLRQFHSTGETASFNNVQRILRHANETSSDTERDNRTMHLRAWGRAAGQLRAFQLKVLVGRRLQDEGKFAKGPPGDGQSPNMLISLFNYGEDIHWGRRREAVSTLNADAFHAAWTRMQFFEGVTGLAHVYLGFSLLVRQALGLAPTS